MKIRCLILFLSLVAAAGARAEEAAAPSVAGKILNDSLPERWAYSEHFNQTSPADDAWWRSFNDALLDSLVAMGERNNYNVAMAAKRMEIARIGILESRSGYYPTFSANASWNKDRMSGAISKKVMNGTDESYFSLGLNMSWQIDVFGRVAAGTKAKKAAYRVSRADRDGVMVTLAGNIATAYVQLRVAQARKSLAEAHLASQKKVLDMTQVRFDCGLVSQLDVQQATTVYASTEASIPQFDTQIHAAINSLAVLLAIQPAEANALLAKPRPLPPYMQIVSTGIPMDLLRRRPDVVEAECNLALYAAELGIAKKDFLPVLSLDASVGTSAHAIGDLFSHDSFTYSIAPTLSWTIFDGMTRKYNVATAKENMEIGIQNYNLTVLQAVTEADNAMYAYLRTLDEIEKTEAAVNASRESLDLSIDLYKRGLAAFTNVIDAQIDYLTYAGSLIESQGQALDNIVTLYEALGGGWLEN